MEGAARGRNAVVEFTDYPTATACDRSPEYQSAEAIHAGSNFFDPGLASLHPSTDWCRIVMDIPAGARTERERGRLSPWGLEMAHTIKVNGRDRTLDVDGDMPLLWAIRDVIGLTGTKYGCGIAQCGACTVHVDGSPTRSCRMTVADAEGAEVVTIEGLKGGVAETVQAVWADLDVPQCGYCQSGQVMAAAALLAENSKPTDDDIDAALWGNLCRCATYQRIRAGVHEAARRLET